MLSLYFTDPIQGKQLNHQIAIYFILIIIVESKYFKINFVIVRMF